MMQLVQAAEEKAADMERRLQEAQAEAAPAAPGGGSTMALLRKVRTLEAQLLKEQARRAAAESAAADVAASRAAAAEAASLREQLEEGERARAEQASRLQMQQEQVRTRASRARSASLLRRLGVPVAARPGCASYRHGEGKTVTATDPGRNVNRRVKSRAVAVGCLFWLCQ